MAKTYIAITGGIGSGKSAALEILRDLGYPAFSCDEIYKDVIQSVDYIKSVEALFPAAVKNEAIDRTALSEIVFNNKEKLKQLNDLAHPLIMDSLFYEMKMANNEIAFAEVPLLFEGDFENLFNKVIYITRDNDQRIAAIIHRDKISTEEAQRRIDNQFDGTSVEGQKRLKNCNAKIISNDGTKADLKNKILEYLNHM